MLSSPRSLYEYYRQVDVGVGEEAAGMDVRSLDQSSACGVELRMQENICILPAMLHLVEMNMRADLDQCFKKPCMGAGW